MNSFKVFSRIMQQIKRHASRPKFLGKASWARKEVYSDQQRGKDKTVLQ